MPKSASKTGLENTGLTANEIRKKYKGYFIHQGEHEKDVDFVRRISFNVVLNENSSITIEEMRVELKELTGMGIVRGFLLSTICFEDSGVEISGNMIWSSEIDKKLSKNILRAGQREILKAGRMISQKELFLRIRKECNRPLLYIDLTKALFNKGTNLKLTERGGEIFVYIKKR